MSPLLNQVIAAKFANWFIHYLSTVFGLLALAVVYITTTVYAVVFLSYFGQFGSLDSSENSVKLSFTSSMAVGYGDIYPLGYTRLIISILSLPYFFIYYKASEASATFLLNLLMKCFEYLKRKLNKKLFFLHILILLPAFALVYTLIF